MSPLAFDKQGKPFAWHRRTRKLLVRMFRNPAARGTCCQVLDGEGSPLYIEAETDYGEFRKAVGNVPGLYRLDQCDDDGVEVDEAQPAYVSIDLTRNASMSGNDGDVNPLVIIEHMFAIHADVMKTMAMQQASIMAASAEILRAPFRPAAPAIEREPREDQGDDEDEDDELEPDPEPDPWAAWRPILKMVEPFLPKLGELLYEQFLNMAKKSKTSPPAAVLNPPPAPASAADGAATPSQTAESTSAAAGTSAAAAGSPATAGKSETVAAAASPSAESLATPAALSATASATTGSAKAASTTGSTKATTAASEPASATTASDTAASGSAPPAPTLATKPSSPTPGTELAAVSGESVPRNAGLSPTPDQWEHLHVIRERLTPRERAIAENAIMRMDADVLSSYLAELSAMTVDEAVALIRSMVGNLPPTPGSRRTD